MKKIITALLTLFIFLFVSGCSKKVTIEDVNWQQQARDYAFGYANAHYMLSYDAKSSNAIVTNVKDKGEGAYTVYGTVTCIDNYNKEYKANWSMNVAIDFEKAQQMIDSGEVKKADDSFYDACKSSNVDFGTPRS